jgi:hypothetical protein
MEKLAFKMEQEAKVCWRYEWPLKRTTKWHVQKFVGQGEATGVKKVADI